MKSRLEMLSSAVSLIVLLTVLPVGNPTALALDDEDRIVYTFGCDEPPDLLDMNLLEPFDSSVTVTETIMDEGASISPGGLHIAAATHDGIVVTDPDGTGGVVLAGTDLARFPAWSPDGTNVAYSSDGQLFVVGYQPYVAPVAVTTQVSYPMSALDWSPDGTTLLWSRIEGDEQLIETVAISDGTRIEIGKGSDARYSADGSWIVFTSHISAPSTPDRIARMDADGSNVVITARPGSVGGLFGDEVAFRDRRVIDGLLTDYIGTYSFGSDTTTVVLDGDAVSCDTVFYVWDWGSLMLPTFRDTAYDDLFFSDIEWLGDQGITKGCNPPGNDLFCPKGILTRGQVAAFLVRALDLPAGAPNAFTDDDSSVFESDIDSLADAGITRGCNPPANDHFCPDDFITRGEIAALLVRALGYVDDGGGNLFVDDDGLVFEHDIDRLATAGVTKGCNPPTNDMYCPTSLITREQFAAMLHRALG